MIKAIVFDMDGTLLDSMHVWDHVAQDYIRSTNRLPQQDIDEVVKTMSLAQSAKYLQSQYQLTQRIDEIQKGIEDMVLHKYEYEVCLKKGAKQCIEYCVSLGVKLAILSASSEAMVQAACKRLGILSSFDYIMTCETIGLSKDDPAIYKKMLDILQVKKEECIFIDDAFHAISCMKQEGYYVVAAYDEANKEQWDTICSISDEHVYDLSKWEVQVCKKY